MICERDAVRGNYAVLSNGYAGDIYLSAKELLQLQVILSLLIV